MEQYLDLQKKEPFPSRLMDIVTFLQTDRKPVDYTQMIAPDCPVVAIGENHGMIGHKIEMLQALGPLRQLGFTHVGMEMVNPADQSLLNQYLATGGGRNELFSHLKKHYGYTKENPKLYMDIIDQANKLGFKIVPIDLSNVEKIPLSVYDSTGEKISDQHMANSVMKILDECPSYKIVTFTGTYHVTNKRDSMQDLLARDGVKITTINFMSTYRNQKKTMDKAIRETNLTLERFMMPNRTFSQWRNQSHWLIHLPETEVSNIFKRFWRIIGF